MNKETVVRIGRILEGEGFLRARKRNSWTRVRGDFRHFVALQRSSDGVRYCIECRVHPLALPDDGEVEWTTAEIAWRAAPAGESDAWYSNSDIADAERNLQLALPRFDGFISNEVFASITGDTLAGAMARFPRVTAGRLARIAAYCLHASGRTEQACDLLRAVADTLSGAARGFRVTLLRLADELQAKQVKRSTDP